MKKKKFKATLAVALVAAAGLGAYETYQDYKTDKERTLVMQNVEALTEDDVIGNEYITCTGSAKWEMVGVDKFYVTERVHDNSTSDKDLTQDYVISCCTASGSGTVIGRNEPPIATISTGSRKQADCNGLHKLISEYVTNIIRTEYP